MAKRGGEDKVVGDKCLGPKWGVRTSDRSRFSTMQVFLAGNRPAKIGGPIQQESENDGRLAFRAMPWRKRCRFEMVRPSG